MIEEQLRQQPYHNESAQSETHRRTKAIPSDPKTIAERDGDTKISSAKSSTVDTAANTRDDDGPDDCCSCQSDESDDTEKGREEESEAVCQQTEDERDGNGDRTNEVEVEGCLTIRQ